MKTFFCKGGCLLIAAIVFFAGCPGTTIEYVEGGEEQFRNPTLKRSVNGQRIIHTLWNEQGVDNRVAIGYELEDGQLFFDHSVQLYALRLRDRDCSQYSEPESCNRIGLHFCFMDLIYNRIFAGYDTYVKPLRDAGIKHVLSIVPQDSGVCVGTLYRWPMEQWYPWATLETGGLGQSDPNHYPFDADAVQGLIDQLVEIYKLYPFDGIGYDEEYGDMGTVRGQAGRGAVYPTGAAHMTGTNPYSERMGSAEQSAAWFIGGGNMLRFSHELVEALAKDKEDPEEFKRNFIFETYEIRYGGTVPVQYTYPADHPVYGGQTILRTELLNYSYDAFYGGWKPDSGNPGFPKNRFGPLAIDLGFEVLHPKPRPDTVEGPIRDFLDYGYGVLMFYCIRSREGYRRDRLNYFGANDTPLEDYLSRISRILYNQNTVYVGQDYPGE